ncbi:unnamed protein product [Camellia sinensis]
MCITEGQNMHINRFRGSKKLKEKDRFSACFPQVRKPLTAGAEGAAPRVACAIKAVCEPLFHPMFCTCGTHGRTCGSPNRTCSSGTIYDGGMSRVSRLYRNRTSCGACYQSYNLMADCQQWRGMRKAYSAVWDMANSPAGALNFRVQVSGSAGLKKVQLTSVIPSEWKAGAVYDTTIQLT